MSDNLQQSYEEVDKDLAQSWIELSANVRNLSSNLNLKAAGTAFSGDAELLSQETSRLCDHVERLHADVIDLLENMESRLPSILANRSSSDVDCDDVDREAIQIQREAHQQSHDFKDIIKALFLWRDDPVERVRDKK